MDLTSISWRKSSYSGCNGGNCVEVANLTDAHWRKSSWSGGNGGNCVEVAALGGANWRTSSYSGANGGNCVQVADLPGTIAVRDSKDPDGPALIFSPADWTAFTARIKAS
jgi:Domain of unknown function (DUF397)